jgi:hypothetical protein
MNALSVKRECRMLLSIREKKRVVTEAVRKGWKRVRSPTSNISILRRSFLAASSSAAELVFLLEFQPGA